MHVENGITSLNAADQARAYNKQVQGPFQSNRALNPARRGEQTHRISELNAQIADEAADVFYCESLEMPADKGEKFTMLSTSKTVKQLKVKIDTGARCNVLSRDVLQHIDPDAHIDHNQTVNLVAYGGQIIKTLGVTYVNFGNFRLQPGKYCISTANLQRMFL